MKGEHGEHTNVPHVQQRSTARRTASTGMVTVEEAGPPTTEKGALPAAAQEEKKGKPPATAKGYAPHRNDPGGGGGVPRGSSGRGGSISPTVKEDALPVTAQEEEVTLLMVAK